MYNGNKGGPEKDWNDCEAAGIIPYYYDKNKKVFSFLMGYNKGPKNWQYFGGKKEKTDKNIRSTAIREAAEESIDNRKGKYYLL